MQTETFAFLQFNYLLFRAASVKSRFLHLQSSLKTLEAWITGQAFRGAWL